MTQSDPGIYWQRHASRGESACKSERLEETLKVDVCVVGGGLTGLWTAIKLKEQEPSLEVALLEKERCGSGYSGRNEGLLSSWWDKYPELETLLGKENALRLARVSDETISAIISFCEREKINTQVRHDGKLRLVIDGHQSDFWKETSDFLSEFGEAPFEEWSPENVISRTGSSIHGIGIYERNAASLDPGVLVNGLHRVAIRRGIQVFEKTPMRDLGFGIRAVVETPKGRVVADKIVLAMGAWNARFPEIRQAVSVTAKQIVVSEPDPFLLEQSGWSNGLVITDNRPLAETYRTTTDGRVVFGKGGVSGEPCYKGNVGALLGGGAHDQKLIKLALQRRLPFLSQVISKMCWRLPVDFTLSGLPLFWHMGPYKNVYYAVGFSDNLIGPSYLSGRLLASLILERVDELSQSSLVRPPSRDFPNEPWRYLRAKIKNRGLSRAELSANRTKK